MSQSTQIRWPGGRGETLLETASGGVIGGGKRFGDRWKGVLSNGGVQRGGPALRVREELAAVPGRRRRAAGRGGCSVPAHEARAGHTEGKILPRYRIGQRTVLPGGAAPGGGGPLLR